MEINALFCPNCNEIIYSRANVHDFRFCSCKNISVDGGFDYFKYSIADNGKYLRLYLNGDKLLETILDYDYRLGNRSISKEHIDGYHGKFKIVKSSNEQFYKGLIKNWNEFQPYFDKIKNGDDK